MAPKRTPPKSRPNQKPKSKSGPAHRPRPHASQGRSLVRQHTMMHRPPPPPPHMRPMHHGFGHGHRPPPPHMRPMHRGFGHGHRPPPPHMRPMHRGFGHGHRPPPPPPPMRPSGGNGNMYSRRPPIPGAYWPDRRVRADRAWSWYYDVLFFVILVVFVWFVVDGQKARGAGTNTVAPTTLPVDSNGSVPTATRRARTTTAASSGGGMSVFGIIFSVVMILALMYVGYKRMGIQLEIEASKQQMWGARDYIRDNYFDRAKQWALSKMSRLKRSSSTGNPDANNEETTVVSPESSDKNRTSIEEKQEEIILSGSSNIAQANRNSTKTSPRPASLSGSSDPAQKNKNSTKPSPQPASLPQQASLSGSSDPAQKNKNSTKPSPQPASLLSQIKKNEFKLRKTDKTIKPKPIKSILGEKTAKIVDAINTDTSLNNQQKHDKAITAYKEELESRREELKKMEEQNPNEKFGQLKKYINAVDLKIRYMEQAGPDSDHRDSGSFEI